MRSFVPTKTTDLGPLSADLIRVRKPHGPPCRIVVNRDPFRDPRLREPVQRRQALQGSIESSIVVENFFVTVVHRVAD